MYFVDFDVLMLDEAHTISEDYEMLTALIQHIWSRRDFYLLISSATVDESLIKSVWAPLDVKVVVIST